MNRQRAGTHVIAGAFVFLLLGVFAVFSVVMVLLCAGAYNQTVGHAEEHNRSRIAPAYLRTMVRGHDETDAIRVERLEGILREDEETGAQWTEPVDLDALVLDDDAAVTRLFVYEGWLYECSEPKEDEGEWESGDLLLDGKAEDVPEESGEQEAVCLGACMEPVCEADGMETEMRDGLLILRLKNDGQWTEYACALHAYAP